MKEWVAGLEPFEKSTDRLNVAIETPKGSRVKYTYDSKNGAFRLSKALPMGMTFPFNFGFIPQTLAEDDDPLDILILNEEPLFCGCLLTVRIFAVLEAEQSEARTWMRNDRVIGEAIGEEAPIELKGLQLSKRTAAQIEFFFKAYNKLCGKKFRVLGIGGARKAHRLVQKAARAFRANGA